MESDAVKIKKKGEIMIRHIKPSSYTVMYFAVAAFIVALVLTVVFS